MREFFRTPGNLYFRGSPQIPLEIELRPLKISIGRREREKGAVPRPRAQGHGQPNTCPQPPTAPDGQAGLPTPRAPPPCRKNSGGKGVAALHFHSSPRPPAAAGEKGRSAARVGARFPGPQSGPFSHCRHRRRGELCKLVADQKPEPIRAPVAKNLAAPFRRVAAWPGRAAGASRLRTCSP